jgi:hypothetical protein
LWPELQGGKAEPLLVEKHNVAFKKEHPGYQGVMHAEKANEEAWDRLPHRFAARHHAANYGAASIIARTKSHIDMLHSFDGGKNWATATRSRIPRSPGT